MNPIIRKLASTTSALDVIRQDLVRCGFELEFHEIDGKSRGDLDDEQEFDVDAPHIEVGDDSSVKGGEIRTVGACTPIEFMAAARALFKNHEFKIDSGCSFHIHLSVKDVTHVYGKQMQAEMMTYLLENQHRLPESVRERMKKDTNYFRFENNQEKYRAVHKHSLGTWEFRLFGNITNEHDAWRCLILAIDTFRHAYRVRCKLTPSLVDIDTASDMQNLAKEAIKHGRSLKKQIRYNRLFRKTQQSA